jgi:predicted helicase
MKGKTGDTGIDLVGEERATGEFCAIQCKFYLPEHTLSQSDIDSFFAALGNAKFSSGLFVSTTDKWGSNAEKRLANPSKPVNRLRVQDLDDSPIDWSGFSLKSPDHLALKTHRTPLSHSRKAIDDVRAGLAPPDTSFSSFHRSPCSPKPSASGQPTPRNPSTPLPCARM